MAYIASANTTDIFMDKDEIGRSAVDTAIVMTSFASVAIGLRYCSKHLVGKRLTFNQVVIELFIAVPYILAWVMCILTDIARKAGFGVYQSRDISFDSLVDFSLTSAMLWIAMTFFLRGAVLLQCYPNLANRPQQIFGSLFWAANCIWALVAAIAAPFRCVPAEASNFSQLHGHCIDPDLYWMWAACIDVILNWIVFLVALVCVRVQRLSKRDKTCAVMLLAGGFCVVLYSFCRLVIVYAVDVTEDYVEAGVTSVSWTAVEVAAGIIVASLMGTRALVDRVRPPATQAAVVNSGTGDAPREWWRKSSTASQVGAHELQDSRNITLRTAEDRMCYGY